MSWLILLPGCLLLWAGVDALRTLSPPDFLNKSMVTEKLLGRGAKPISDYGEKYVRTRLLIQDSSLAILMAIIFVLAGIVTVVGAIWVMIDI